MSVLAIDINDAGLRAARAGEGLLAVDDGETSSPGLVWRRGKDDLVTGVAAAARATHHPGDVRDRFWDRLDTEGARPNRAELACAHLGAVVRAVAGPGDEVVFAVPTSYDEHQLGLLVGIARDLGLSLAGLVARPAAIDVPALAAEPVIVVEAARHRALLSVVEGGDHATLVDTRDAPDLGLVAFRRQWIKVIGREFVRRTRFDPLHDAATEAPLHARLSDLLDAVARDGRDDVTVATADGTHRITVTEPLLAEAGQSLVFDLAREVAALGASHAAAAIVLDHEAARVPGLARTLERQAAAPVHSLPSGAAALGLAAAWPEGFAAPDAAGVAFHVRRRRVGAPGARP